MSLVRLDPENFEQFTLHTNPLKQFSSSSLGVTGSVYLFARHSDIEKELREFKDLNSSSFKDFNIPDQLQVARESALSASNIEAATTKYIELIHSQSKSSIKGTTHEIKRIVPPQRLNEDFLKKFIFAKMLMGHHRVNYPKAHFGYTNYNSLNFFTASSVPEDTALLYPNQAGNADSVYASGSYTLRGPFTFDFYLNPRYTTDTPGFHMHAGTVFHLSSSYAVSVITGSSKDVNGYPNAFRLMLQVSHSADTKPSRIRLSQVGNFPNDMVYLSEDNSLKRNHWHHCVIRWGTKDVNEGSGSFIIDNQERGSFVITASSIAPLKYSAPQGNPDVLFIGNYYEGINVGNNAQMLFFANRPASRDGLVNLAPNNSTAETPNNFKITHPLNAEVHDLKIFNTFRGTNQIYTSSLQGVENTRDLLFYLPPFFTKESPTRKSQNGTGGVLETPFVATNGSTTTPINVPLSFRIGVLDTNLENFTRDFKTGNYPRLLNLTSSNIVRSANTALSSSNFMYTTGSFLKRNLTLLPCDNGKFIPNFSLLQSGTISNKPKIGSTMDRFVNDFGNLDIGWISLNNLIDSGSLPENSTLRTTISDRNQLLVTPDLESDAIYESLVGVDEKNYAGQIGPYMAAFYKTRDNSSNEITLYDISNLFYDYRINPGSFEIKDTNITGSNQKIKITLKDNGFGSLYRADSITPHPVWASVGTIFYDEGIVGVVSPHIPYHGKNGFEIKFKGEHNIHIMKIHTLAGSGQINSSSNTSYDPLISSSLNANNTTEQFVYISSINFHDVNLNVVLKQQLAQPLVKKLTDRIAFKTSIDF